MYWRDLLESDDQEIGEVAFEARAMVGGLMVLDDDDEDDKEGDQEPRREPRRRATPLNALVALSVVA